MAPGGWYLIVNQLFNENFEEKFLIPGCSEIVNDQQFCIGFADIGWFVAEAAVEKQAVTRFQDILHAFDMVGYAALEHVFIFKCIGVHDASAGRAFFKCEVDNICRAALQGMCKDPFV